MSKLVAHQIQCPRTGRGTFLHPTNPNEEVRYGYFKIPLYIYNLSTSKKFSRRVGVIDIVGSKVIWAFLRDDASYKTGLIRFTKLITDKRGIGFIVKGNFLKL